MPPSKRACSGEVKDILLLDVTPLSLGIETKGGVMTKLIERKMTIPTKKSEVSPSPKTCSHRSRSHVLQGAAGNGDVQQDARQVRACRLAAGAEGRAGIEVTFDIDANGIVHVSARDRCSVPVRSSR